MFEDQVGTRTEGGIGRRGRVTRLVAAGGVAALLSGFTGCFPHHDPPAPPDPVTVTFETAGAESWVVPAGVTSVEVVLCGAQGGSGNGFTGGLGGRTAATVTVSPGDVLEVNVGGDGGALPDFGSTAGAAGGVNGGGNGGDGGGGAGAFFGGAGGGGGTDLRPAGAGLEGRLVVAGGGGGVGKFNDGGVGGGATGGPGDPDVSPPGDGGGGGTQAAGGAGGGASGGPAGDGGMSGAGGTGHTALEIGVYGGGGGGGGFWGGGGGGGLAGGGGGGSGFADPGFTSGAVLEAGHADCAGDGFVTITYTPAAP